MLYKEIQPPIHHSFSELIYNSIHTKNLCTMKWLLLGDYTHHLHAKESTVFKYISWTPNLVWFVYEGRKGKFMHSTSHVEGMKVLYNAKKNESSEIREGVRKAGWQKSLNLHFWYQYDYVFQKWVEKTHWRKKSLLYHIHTQSDFYLIQVRQQRDPPPLMTKVGYNLKTKHRRLLREEAKLNDE